jgi:hypothetical protein
VKGIGQESREVVERQEWNYLPRTSNRQRCVRLCIVVMEMPRSCSSHILSFCSFD